MDRTKALKLLRLSEPFSSAELEAAYSTRLGNIHADFQDQVKIAYGFLADELQKLHRPRQGRPPLFLSHRLTKPEVFSFSIKAS